MNSLQNLFTFLWALAAFFWLSASVVALVKGINAGKAPWAILVFLGDLLMLGVSAYAMFLYDGSPL